MISSQFLQQAIVWILTYSVHSTLLLFAAWLATRWLAAERIRLRERIWKTALFGGLLSASLQVGFDVSPAAGRLEWAQAEVTAVHEQVEAPGVLTSSAGFESALTEFSWERLLVGLWVLGGFLGIALLLFTWRRVTDRMAGRKPVREGHARESLTRLAERAGLRQAPRLTVSRQLKSPATIGVFLPQICVPQRALDELPPDQQEALIAHELAHILRGDPLWFFLCGLLERLFFFQPLNRIARRELEELAEFLSDDWAAQNTGNELGLARCLTEVATWVLERRPAVALVPMASHNSRLAARIGRLLDDERTPQDHARSPRAWAFPASALSAAVLLLPGAAAIAESETTPREPSFTPHSRQAVRRTPAASAPATITANDPVDADSLGLDELLQVLDSEVEELAREVSELSTEFATEPSPSAQRIRTLSDIGQRMRNLRERRERLRQLLPALERELESGPALTPSTSTHPRNPKQEESR